jgi:hypothetical protein
MMLRALARDASLLLLAACCAGCLGAILRDREYGPAYRGSAKANVPGPAVVLPIQDCTMDDPKIAPDYHGREVARAVLQPELWKQLKQPGQPREGRFAGLCGLFYKELERDSEWEFDVVTRREVEKLLARYPGKRSLVVVLRGMRYRWQEQRSTVNDSTGRTVGSYGTGKVDRWENGDSEVKIRVISPTGYVWMAGAWYHGDDYRHAGEQIQDLLAGFPFQILEAPPAGATAPATDSPASAADGGALPPDDVQQKFRAMSERNEVEYRNLREAVADMEADYQGWTKTATPAQLESPEYKAAAERHDESKKSLDAIEAEHQELLAKIAAWKDAPSNEQAQTLGANHRALLGKLREEKLSFHKVVLRLKDITRRYKR